VSGGVRRALLPIRKLDETATKEGPRIDQTAARRTGRRPEVIMTRSTSIITAALAALAIAAPAATAMPVREHGSTSGEVGITTAPQQDHRSADARDASTRPQTGTPSTPGGDLRSADARDAGITTTTPRGLPTWPVDPKPIASAPVNDAAPVAADDDTSPFVYILPGVLASLILAAGMGYAVRTSGRARRARIGA
jgi:regulator of extracellular matrix RemA (YlzA/DUF370 family)